MASMEVKTLTILEKSQPEQSRGFTIFGGPLGDKMEYFRVQFEQTNIPIIHIVFFPVCFLKWLELAVFDFLKGEKLRKTVSFHLERLQSERNKRKYIRRGIPLSFVKGLRSDVPKKTTASSRKKKPSPQKSRKFVGDFFLKTLRKARLM